MESEMSVCESCAEACKRQQMLFYRDLYLNASLHIWKELLQRTAGYESGVQAG